MQVQYYQAIITVCEQLCPFFLGRHYTVDLVILQQ